MPQSLPQFIFAAGIGQLLVLVAAALVPFRLDWKTELSRLGTLHRQMYVVYGAYIALAIAAFGLISLANADALADGSRLARCVCGYIAVFWGIRLLLQAVFQVKEHLTTWWLRVGYHMLTLLFAFFTVTYSWAALRPAAS